MDLKSLLDGLLFGALVFSSLESLLSKKYQPAGIGRYVPTQKLNVDGSSETMMLDTETGELYSFCKGSQYVICWEDLYNMHIE